MDQDAPPPLISSLPDAEPIGATMVAEWQPPRSGSLAWQQRLAERAAKLLRRSVKAVVIQVAGPDGGLTKEAHALLQDFLADLMSIFITAARLRAFTITPATIEEVVDDVLKGELVRFAKSVGALAVARWTASYAPPAASAGGARGGARGWGHKSRSQRAGLLVSVNLVERAMRAPPGMQVSQRAPIFLAVVLELLLAETLELAGLQRAARISKHPALPPTPISVRDIFQALLADEELRHLLLPLPLPATEE